MFYLGEDLFDGVQVGRVFRQEEQLGAGCTDELADGFAFVAAKIVHDDDVAGLQGGEEDLLDVSCEALAVDRTIEKPRSSIRSWRSAATKVVVFQRPCGTLAVSLIPRGAQPRSGAMLVLVQSVDEYQALRLDPVLILCPLRPPSCDVGTIAFASHHAFF